MWLSSQCSISHCSCLCTFSLILFLSWGWKHHLLWAIVQQATLTARTDWVSCHQRRVLVKAGSRNHFSFDTLLFMAIRSPTPCGSSLPLWLTTAHYVPCRPTSSNIATALRFLPLFPIETSLSSGLSAASKGNDSINSGSVGEVEPQWARG